MIRKAWDAVLAFLEYRRAVAARQAELQRQLAMWPEKCGDAVLELMQERDQLREALQQIAETREPIFGDDAYGWRECAVRRRTMALDTLANVPLG